jgi:DNA (cytosine-5)-methyltransferase 1
VADGVASRLDRLKAIGNGQIPIVAALAFETLHRRLR